MGGTVGVGDLNTEVSQKDKQKIWDRCIKHVPSLKVGIVLSATFCCFCQDTMTAHTICTEVGTLATR